MPDVDEKQNVHRLNPAGRLLIILNRIKDSVASGTPWGAVLGVSEQATSAELLNSMSLVAAIPSQIEKQVNRLALDHKQFIDTWRQPFNNAIPFMNLRNSLKDFDDRVTEICIASLGFVSHTLANNNLEPDFDQAVLAEIRGNIWDLIQNIQDASDLDPSLSEYLLHHLYFIANAIDEYEYAGIVPLVRSINAAVGTVVTYPNASKAKNTPFGKRFWELIIRVGNVASAARAGSFLLEKGAEIFLSSE